MLQFLSNRLKPTTLLKVTLFHGYFSRFLNCTNAIGRKLPSGWVVTRLQHRKALNFIKKKLQRKCFPVKFSKFLRTTFFTEHSDDCFWNFDCDFVAVTTLPEHFSKPKYIKWYFYPVVLKSDSHLPQKIVVFASLKDL